MERRLAAIAALTIAAGGAAVYFLAANREEAPAASQTQSPSKPKLGGNLPNFGVEDRTTPTQLDTSELRESLRVQLRSLPRIDASKYPVEDYDALKALALKGDPDAAFLLAQWLESCRHAPPPESEQDLERAINDIQQTHRVRSYRDGRLNHGQLKNPSEKQIALAQEVQRRQYKSCNGLALETRDEAADWLDLAEANGSDDARFRRAASGRLAANESIQVLNEIWQEGNPAALLSLSKVYRDEYNSGDWPEAEPKSVGAELAFLVTQDALLREAGMADEIPDNLGQVNAAVLHRLSMLVPYKRDEAYEFARKLLGDNENCCMTHFRRSQPE